MSNFISFINSIVTIPPLSDLEFRKIQSILFRSGYEWSGSGSNFYYTSEFSMNPFYLFLYEPNQNKFVCNINFETTLEELFIDYPHLKQNINLIDLLNSLPVKISTLFSEPYFNSYVLKINEGISYALINGKWENFMKDPEIK